MHVRVHFPANIHVGPEAILKGCHGSQGPRPHGDVGQFVGGAVSMNSVEIWSSNIHTSQDKVGSNVALIGKEMLLQHP